MAAWARAWPAAAPSAPRPLPSQRPAGSELAGLAASGGRGRQRNRQRTSRQSRPPPNPHSIPQGPRLDPAYRGSGPCADGVGWADRSRPGYSKHPIGPVGQRWYPLKLLGTDLVSHRHPRVRSREHPPNCSPCPNTSPWRLMRMCRSSHGSRLRGAAEWGAVPSNNCSGASAPCLDRAAGGTQDSRSALRPLR